jgi:hypothetical protein
MSADQLFELGEGDRRPEAEPQPKVSTDRRRTLKQLARLEKGLHPLFLDTPHRLHPDAAPMHDRSAEGRRCGGCRWLTHNGTYLKCGYGDGVRITYGPGSDLRKWWPGCTEHEAADA